MFERFCKWIGRHTSPTSYPLLPTGLRPITEGKTRGNIKTRNPAPKRPKGGPPAPTPKYKRLKLKKDNFAPNYAIECDWISIYIADSKSEEGYRKEIHHRVKFWVDPNGNLVVFKGLLDNQQVYHDYIKYITHNAQSWV